MCRGFVILKVIIGLFFGVFFLSACSFESDLDILNKFNQKYKQGYDLEAIHYFCFDVDGMPFVDGDINEINGVNYRCDSGSDSVWVEEIQ